MISCLDNSSLKFIVETTLANVMGTKNLSKTFDVISAEGVKVMELLLEGKNAKESKEVMRMKIDCVFNNQYFQILNKLSYIFYVLSNFADGKNFRKIYKSEELGTNYTNFDEMIIEKTIAYDSEIDPMKIEFYDMNFKVFAYIKTSINEIITKKPVEIFCFKSNKSVGYANIRVIIEPLKNFVDYLSDGMQINLVVGIDFTASNNSPSDPNSLHYCNSKEPNFYERAISSCGNILSYYDYDKIFPVFGFGAQMIGSNTVQHCFNLNFDVNPNIIGIENVLATYKNNVYQLNFSGPTYFTPLIRNVINVVKFNMDKNSKELEYYILLILTDGQINDMAQTCDAIVEASNYPISIIIIGVGNANFSNMVILGNLFFDK